MPLYPKGLTWVTPICLDDANVIQRVFGRKNAACSDEEEDGCVNSRDEYSADEVFWIPSGREDSITSTEFETQSMVDLPKAILGRPCVSMEYLVARFHAFDRGAMIRERVWFGSDSEEEEYGSEDSSDDEDLDMGEAEGYEADEDPEEAEVLGKSVQNGSDT